MNPIVAVIIGCEIGFWLLVLGGLTLRYVLDAQLLSRFVLLLVPLLDVVLLVAVALDIARGTPVTTVHRIAGLYLGVTVAFGHSLIAWTDVRFRHWFAGGPAPTKAPLGMPAFRAELASFGHWLLAAAVAALAILGLGVTVADQTQRSALFGTFPMIGIVTVIWLLSGPVWAALELRRKPQ